MKKLVYYLFLFCCTPHFAQEAWELHYNFGGGFQMLESYDGGTVIAATAEGQALNGKVFKLNSLGEFLWTHSFDDDELFMPLAMMEAKNGDLIIGGATSRYDYWRDGFILRLNACGELIWFTNVGIEVGIDDDGDIINHILMEEDGSIVASHYRSNQDERISLIKLNSQGELLWSQSYFLGYAWGGLTNDLIKCKDGGYAIAGKAYVTPYYNQNTTLGIMRNLVHKTDSLGNLQWSYILNWELDSPDSLFKGSSKGIDQLANGHYMVHGTHYIDSRYPPLIYELDENGNLLWWKDVSKPELYYTNSKSILAADSTLIVAAPATATFGDLNYHLEFYKMDLQGNMINEFVNPTNSSLLRDLRWNTDSSTLLCLPGGGPAGYLYAFKLKPNTMLLDSFALEDNNLYDYLCPEPIVNQDIFLPELSITEASNTPKSQLHIAPNPATNYSYFNYDIQPWNGKAKLELRNALGKLLHTEHLQHPAGSLYHNTSNYPPGMYFLTLLVEGVAIETIPLSLNK